MKNKYYYTVLPYSYYRKNRKYANGSFMAAQDATMTRNFSKGKGTGSVMGMLGGAADIVGKAVDLAQIEDTTALEDSMENMGTDVSASSLDSLMEQWGASANTGNSYSWRDVRGKTDGEIAGGILGAGLSGATAGAAAGPIGAIVGGAIGLIGSGIGAAVGRNKAERKAGQLNDMANEANLRQQLAFASNADSIMDQQNLAAMSTLAAHGGRIHIKPSKRGTFTAAAKRRGLGVQEFASKVLANKDRYSSAMVKKANFARNFGGHRKDEGGENNTVTTNDIVNALHLTDEFYDLWETIGRDSVLNRQRREAEVMREYLKDTQGAEIHISDTSFDRMPVFSVRDTETNADLGIGLADSHAGVFRGSENIFQEYGVPPQVIIGAQESPRFVEDGMNGNIIELGPVDVVAHERAHATGSTFSTPFSNKLLHKLLLSPYNGYDETPEERGANLMGLRALMYKEGIKEAAEGGEITMEQLKEMKKKYPKLRIFQFNEGNEEDLLKALNLIAQNNTSDTKSGTSHMAAKGGPVSTRNNFSNGVVKVENGGTHEQNPMEGVPMGIAPDGLPNLVEEGEVIFNDYVFSNRLKPDRKDLERMGLKKYNNKTFAQIARNLQKESEERPNDPISKNGLEDSMAKLTVLQEEVRNGTGKRNVGRIMWPGGPLGEDLPDYWISSKYFEEPHIYGTALPDSSEKTTESPTKSSFSPDPNMSFIQTRFFPSFPSQSILYPQSTGKTSEQRSGEEDSSENLSDTLPTGLRYAPAVGSLIGSIASAFAKPDYEHSNSLMEAASRQRPSRVRFRPVGNYMRYTPLNTSYMMNRLNAETAGIRRALENMSGGNAAAARNQLTALNRSSQDALGDAFIKANQYNDSLRRQVEEFNRGTNMFNSQGAMQADSANAQMQNAYDARRLAAVEQAMRMREASDAALEQSRALNFTNLFDNLGDIGREDFSFNQTRIPGLRYGYTDKDGNTVWLNSYGGMLTKRTGKRRRR